MTTPAARDEALRGWRAAKIDLNLSKCLHIKARLGRGHVRVVLQCPPSHRRRYRLLCINEW